MAIVGKNSSASYGLATPPRYNFFIMEHQVSLTSRWFAALEPRVRDNEELGSAFDLAGESRRSAFGLATFYRVYCTTRTQAILHGLAELYCSDAVPEIIRAMTTPLF